MVYRIRKKPRDHEENKSKKYSVIKYKGLEEKMSLLVFFSEKVFLMKCNNMWLYALQKNPQELKFFVLWKDYNYDILKENDKLECC